MRRELSKAEVERLFVGAVDEALLEGDAAKLTQALARDGALKGDYERYARAVAALKSSPPTRAPDALASMVLRRVRRRRGLARRLPWSAEYRVPAEVLVPILLAVMVALFLLTAP